MVLSLVILMVSIFSYVACADEICGDALVWSVTENILTVSGTGEMYDFVSTSSAPWYNQRDEITQVIVKNGVESIGYGAFRGLYNLEKIDLPESVVQIDRYAFDGCSLLAEIHIDENNAVYSSKDGILFNKSMTKLLQYATGNKRNVYVIPTSVTEIDWYAFSVSNNLKKIVIGEKVKTIGYRAFYRIYSITDVYYTGGSADWKSISVGSYNAGITNAKKHYCCEATTDFDAEKNEITVSSINPYEKALVCKAYYKSEKMLSRKCTEVKINTGTNTFAVPQFTCEDADKMKLFVWASSVTAKPLCEIIQEDLIN